MEWSCCWWCIIIFVSREEKRGDRRAPAFNESEWDLTQRCGSRTKSWLRQKTRVQFVFYCLFVLSFFSLFSHNWFSCSCYPVKITFPAGKLMRQSRAEHRLLTLLAFVVQTVTSVEFWISNRQPCFSTSGKKLKRKSRKGGKGKAPDLISAAKPGQKGKASQM
jgi:hypothetical protein